MNRETREATRMRDMVKAVPRIELAKASNAKCRLLELTEKIV